ncbi:MAG: GTP-binding protein [Thermodesulfobacteriota bacterium]
MTHPTRLIVIGGFLGAGKTSLLLAWARLLLTRATRVAVLENEAGRVGVDDAFLRGQGLFVRHVLGGCACCDGLGRILDQLLALLDAAQYEVIFLEPTGVAALDQLLANLPADRPGLVIQAVALADATRFATLLKGLPKLAKAQVAPAQAVVITKTDLVDAAGRAAVAAAVAGINPAARRIEADLLAAAGDAALALEGLLGGPAATPRPQGEPPAPGASLSLELDLPEAGLPAGEAESLVAALVAGLLGAGGLGHVKLQGQDSQGQAILVSATGPADLSRRGPAAALVGRARLAVIAADRDAAALTAGLARLLPGLDPGLAIRLARALPPLPGLGGLGGA